MGQFVNLTSSDGFVVPAWVAQPKGTPRGAVVVVQEIFGVNSHIQSVADRLAVSGYLAVAPATFERVKAGVDLGYTSQDMQAGIDLKSAVEALPAPGVMADIQAAIDYAAKESGGKVGIVGFCWGGLLTWRAACTLNGLSAAVPYYGGGVTTAEEVARTPKVPAHRRCPYWPTLVSAITSSRSTACMRLPKRTPMWKCMCMRPTTALTATSAAATTKPPQRRPTSARWHFLPNTWAESGRMVDSLMPMDRA